MLLTLAMTLMASALPAAACRNNFVFSKYGICSAATREDMVIGYWQAKTESGISNLEVKLNFSKKTGVASFTTKIYGRKVTGKMYVLSNGSRYVYANYQVERLVSA